MSRINSDQQLRLPPKVNMIYAVGLPTTDNSYKEMGSIEKTQTRVRFGAGMGNMLKIFQTQAQYYNSAIGAANPSLLHIKDSYVGLALSLLMRNSQARNRDHSAMNRYGFHLEKIAGAFDLSQEANVGALIKYVQLDSLGQDTVEKTLVNYYTAIGLEPYDMPATKHRTLMSQLGLDLDWDKVIEELDTARALTVADNELVVRFRKSHLIPGDFSTDFQSRLLMCALTDDQLAYLQLLYNEGILSVDFYTIFFELLNFAPVGSLVLFYTALICESLYIAANYIASLSDDISLIDYSDFINSDFHEERQAIAVYLSLAHDACAILEGTQTYAEASTLMQRLKTDIQTLATSSIASVGDFRLGEFYGAS